MARKLEVEIVGDASSLNRELGKATGTTTSFGGKLGKLGGAAKLAAGGAGIGALVAGLKSSVEAFVESERVSAQTNAVLKSTGGVAKISAKQIGDLATSISKKSGIDDQAIQSGANLLLTFTNIRNETGRGNDIFNRATQTIADMSTALGQDLKTSSIQLGKALNDPIKGVSALARVGVSFTAQQKEQIKTLVEHGNALAAQKIILGELSKEFGGSATAAGQTFEGQMNKLKVSLGQISEAIGGALVPLMQQTGTVTADVVAWFRKHDEAAKALFLALTVVAGVLATYKVATVAVEVATKAARIATVAYTAAQWLLNAALLANPLGAVVVGLAAVAAALVIAYTRVRTFREAVNNTFDWIKDHWPLLVSILTGPIGTATIAIIRHWGDIKNAITGAFMGMATVAESAGKRIKEAVEGVGSKIMPIFRDIRDVVKDIIGWVGKLAGGIETVVGAIGKIKVPKIDIGPIHIGDPTPEQLAEGGGTGPNPRLVRFGRFAQSLGFQVGEHPAFGGVAPVHAHYGAPDHYHGGALDINWPDAGAEPRKLDTLRSIINQWIGSGRLSPWGPGVLWRVAGHFDHLHLSAHALGTAGALPGWAMVGERGPELVKFRGGEQVIPNSMLERGGGQVIVQHHYHGPVVQDREFLRLIRNMDAGFARQNGRPAFGGTG